MKQERKFGAMPDEKSQGPISASNYSWRAEAHCAVKSVERKGEHPTLALDSPDLLAWTEYFERWLGGWPHCFRMLMEREIKEMTLPAALPQWFDGTFSPTPGWKPFVAPPERLTAYYPERLHERPSTKQITERHKSLAQLDEENLIRYRQAAIEADERIAAKAKSQPESQA